MIKVKMSILLIALAAFITVFYPSASTKLEGGGNNYSEAGGGNN